MSKVIVDYYIGTYDRKQKSQTGCTTTPDQQQVNMGQSTTEENKRKQRSIHQIFSDSINEIVRTACFSQQRRFELTFFTGEKGVELVQSVIRPP